MENPEGTVIRSTFDVRLAFRYVRVETVNAWTRSALSSLYERADFLVALMHAPCWMLCFGDDAREYHEVSIQEFHKTARMINARARRIGLLLIFDEAWRAYDGSPREVTLLRRVSMRGRR